MLAMDGKQTVPNNRAVLCAIMGVTDRLVVLHRLVAVMAYPNEENPGYCPQAKIGTHLRSAIRQSDSTARDCRLRLHNTRGRLKATVVGKHRSHHRENPTTKNTPVEASSTPTHQTAV